jgi:tRNA(Ile)-lysidine synthase
LWVEYGLFGQAFATDKMCAYFSDFRRGDDAVGVKLQSAFDIQGQIAVAVSGGSDSLALLHLVAREVFFDRIVALTVDHGLRAESAAEAEQVAQWCAALGVSHHTLKWVGEKPSTGIQAAARQARYDLMTQWCLNNGVATLMTAHTANDQAETVVMRKTRTDSLRSISGIWPKTVWNGVTILRPLLQETREDLRDVLRNVGQDWIDDPSNENSKYERIRVRKDLASSDIGALANEALQAQTSVIAEDAAVKDWLSVFGRMAETGVLTVQRVPFAALDHGLAQAILRWAFWACGGGHSVPPHGLRHILDVIKTGDNTRRTLAGGVVAMRGTTLVFGREPARIEVAPVMVPPSGTLMWDNRFVIAAPPGSLISAVGAAKHWKALLPKGPPAFAYSSLPMVRLAAGAPILPHFEGAAEISVKLCDRMRLS